MANSLITATIYPITFLSIACAFCKITEADIPRASRTFVIVFIVRQTAIIFNSISGVKYKKLSSQKKMSHDDVLIP